MRRILLTGKDGQLGWELQRTFAPLGKVFAYDRKTLDLADPWQLQAIIQDVRPHLILNAAAYTAVDKAETDEHQANLINGIAPGIMAEEAKKLDALLIHYSTDYVFDGIASTPYRESDIPNPLNVYGKTKLAGERAIEAVGGLHLILRTSWVYGSRGKNFLLTMLRLAKERDTLKIVGDQFGIPTWSRMLAETTTNMFVSMMKTGIDHDLWGIYHMTSTGSTSWYDFAAAILEITKIQFPSHPMPQLNKITTDEFPLPAKRPLNSVLSNEKLQKTFGLQMPHWERTLQLCMEHL